MPLFHCPLCPTTLKRSSPVYTTRHFKTHDPTGIIAQFQCSVIHNGAVCGHILINQTAFIVYNHALAHASGTWLEQQHVEVEDMLILPAEPIPNLDIQPANDSDDGLDSSSFYSESDTDVILVDLARDNIQLPEQLVNDQKVELLQLFLKGGMTERFYRDDWLKSSFSPADHPLHLSTLKEYAERKSGFNPRTANRTGFESISYYTTGDCIYLWMSIPSMRELILSNNQRHVHPYMRNLEEAIANRKDQMTRHDYQFSGLESGMAWLEVLERTRHFWSNRLLPDMSRSKYFRCILTLLMGFSRI